MLSYGMLSRRVGEVEWLAALPNLTGFGLVVRQETNFNGFYSLERYSWLFHYD
jgi:hypothetical protein